MNTSPSDEDICKYVRRLIEVSKFDETTVGHIIQKLERHFKGSLSDRYALIKQEIVKCMEIIRSRILKRKRDDMSPSQKGKGSPSDSSVPKKQSPFSSKSPQVSKSPSNSGSDTHSNGALPSPSPISTPGDSKTLEQKSPDMTANLPANKVMKPSPKITPQNSKAKKKSSMRDSSDDTSDSSDSDDSYEAKKVAKPKILFDLEKGVSTPPVNHKDIVIPPKLAKLLGSSTMDRLQVIKKLWSIIKERNLQPPENRKLIVFDDELQAIFGTKQISITKFANLMDEQLKPREAQS